VVASGRAIPGEALNESVLDSRARHRKKSCTSAASLRDDRPAWPGYSFSDGGRDRQLTATDFGGASPFPVRIGA
jgi:hypothetical protein